jgi:hypothetical protein
MDIPPGSTVQIEAIELVLMTVVSTLEQQHPGTIRAALQAIERGNSKLRNVVSLQGQPLQDDPDVIAYALNLLETCEG